MAKNLNTASRMQHRLCFGKMVGLAFTKEGTSPPLARWLVQRAPAGVHDQPRNLQETLRIDVDLEPHVAFRLGRRVEHGDVGAFGAETKPRPSYVEAVAPV
jgi:hypothetical protein